MVERQSTSGVPFIQFPHHLADILPGEQTEERKVSEKLRAEEIERQARELCGLIFKAWREVGCDNRPVRLDPWYTIGAIQRARELFLQVPENLNAGTPKADFWLPMHFSQGETIIILVTPGGVL